MRGAYPACPLFSTANGGLLYNPIAFYFVTAAWVAAIHHRGTHMSKAKTHKFRAETQKVLNILTHSLYTNREIFLRELLSNASDALDKLRFLQSKGESIRDAGLPLEIRITVDKAAGVLQVADTGLGMTEQELIDNLGTIARSGSEQFLKDMDAEAPAPGGAERGGKNRGNGKDNGKGNGKDHGEDNGEKPAEAHADAAPGGGEAAEAHAGAPSGRSAVEIIGRFGIGFYSVFMAADTVEVISLPALAQGAQKAQGREGSEEGEGPRLWTSDGSGSFSVRALEGEEAAPYTRGTVIRAKIKDDAKEFLEKYRLEEIIRRHSNFLPFPIFLEGERVNTTPALWREPKFSITPEQYADFYKHLTYDGKPPLDVIHLSVDAPVQFNALLFLPDSGQDYFGARRDEWGPDLYVRRVLIKRADSDLLPQYLAFVKGVVDTEDLPLNISRETLQENLVLRKISQTAVRHVLGHLEKLAASDKEKYEAFWKLHGKYFKFGCNDYAHRDRVAPLLRFASSALEGDALTGLDGYLERARPGQKEIWHVAAPSAEAAKVNPHLDRFRRKGVEVLYLLEPMDELALETLGKYKDFAFKSVEQADAKSLEAYPDQPGQPGQEDAAPAAKPLTEEENAAFGRLVERMRSILGGRVTDIRVSDRLAGSPAVLVSPDGVSSSMEKLIRVMSKNDEPPKKILEINPDHPLLRALLRIHTAGPENPLLAEMVDSLFDNVQLLDGYLGDPYLMADRNLRLMDKAAAWYADLLKI